MDTNKRDKIAMGILKKNLMKEISFIITRIKSIIIYYYICNCALEM